MSVQPEKSVISKIKKLLALAGSPNVHEAAAALKKAQRLMVEHHLSQTAVDLAAFEESKSYRIRNNAQVLPNWIQGLMKLVANAFGVRAIIHKFVTRISDRVVGRKNSVVFVGPPERGALAAYAFMVLHRQLLRGRSLIMEVTGDLKVKKRSERTKRADWFCEGWVDGVAKILNEFEMSPEERKLMEVWETGQNLPVAMGRKAKSDPDAWVYYQIGKREGGQAQIYRAVNEQGSGREGQALLTD